MKNIVYVNRAQIVINAKGNVVEGVRADASKNQRTLDLQIRKFDNLKAALTWLNREGSRTNTRTYVMYIRPSANGQYEIRSGSYSLPRTSTAKKSSTSSNTSPSSSARSTSSTSSKSTSNRSSKATISARKSNERTPSTTSVTPSGSIKSTSSSSTKSKVAGRSKPRS